jgi:2,3-bisphosphoglycerate-dependent phosphoglycerate mutase
LEHPDMLRIVLVRHAESAPDKSIPEPEWPLSEKGRGQAIELVPRLAAFAPTAIYSSPYPRAVHTVQPLADHLGLKIATHADLRERKLSGQLLPDWLQHVERGWADLSYRVDGGESGAQCQERVLAVLRDVAGRHSQGSVIISSHGNALGLALKHLDPNFGFAQWRAMRNPDVFEVVVEGDGWQWLK